MTRYGKTLESFEAIKEYIETAKPGELAILTFPIRFEQSIRERLAEFWGECDYCMNPKKDGLGIVAFIPREHAESSPGDSLSGERDGT